MLLLQDMQMRLGTNLLSETVIHLQEEDLKGTPEWEMTRPTLRSRVLCLQIRLRSRTRALLTTGSEIEFEFNINILQNLTNIV